MKRQPSGGVLFLAITSVIALFIWACMAGCVSPKLYDPITAEEIQVTIDRENLDYQETRTALEAAANELAGATLQALKKAIYEQQVRHESEMTRLEQWKATEGAKKRLEER